MKKKNNAYMSMLPYVILAIILVVSLFAMNIGSSKINELTTGELIKEIQNFKFKIYNFSA